LPVLGDTPYRGRGPERLSGAGSHPASIFTYDKLNGVYYQGMLTSTTFASNVSCLHASSADDDREANNAGTNKLQMANQYTYTPSGKVASKAVALVSNNHSPGGVLAAGSVTVNYTYDSQGVLTTIAPQGAPTFTYGLDVMERPNGLTDSTGYTWVLSTSVSYNAANQLLMATFPAGPQTWGYNSLLQMNQQTVNGLAINYNYTPGADNGQLASVQDLVAGALINYTYDSLKALGSRLHRPADQQLDGKLYIRRFWKPNPNEW
jgi:hypothetical protein